MGVKFHFVSIKIELLYIYNYSEFILNDNLNGKKSEKNPHGKGGKPHGQEVFGSSPKMTECSVIPVLRHRNLFLEILRSSRSMTWLSVCYFLFMNLHFQLNGIVNFVSPSLVKSILTPRSRSPMFCGSANVA